MLSARRAIANTATSPKSTKGVSGLLDRFLFFDARGLTDFLAEVVEAAAADDAALAHFNLLDARAVHEERLLDANPVRHTAHRHHRVRTAALADRDDAFEHLHAFLTAFGYLGIDLDRIARPKVGDRILELFAIQYVDDVHGTNSLYGRCKYDRAWAPRQPRDSITAEARPASPSGGRRCGRGTVPAAKPRSWRDPRRGGPPALRPRGRPPDGCSSGGPTARWQRIPGRPSPDRSPQARAGRSRRESLAPPVRRQSRRSRRP